MSTSKSKPEFEVAETALRQRVLSPSLSEFQSKSLSRPSSQTQEHILQQLIGREREMIPMIPIIPIPVIPEDAESLANTNTNSNSSPDQQNVPMAISTVPPSSSAPAFTATGSGGSVAGTSGGIVKSITMNEPITTGSGKPIASNKFTRKRERVCNNSS
ncbi:GD16729 [Drosophila simulans]|uniref:GD16729 n=1 Tax=Drosophila simulans TaxID=7240 RepID=B4R4T5_DROSI|nr:GD16729 [Drosophila simulans]